MKSSCIFFSFDQESINSHDRQRNYTKSFISQRKLSFTRKGSKRRKDTENEKSSKPAVPHAYFSPKSSTKLQTDRYSTSLNELELPSNSQSRISVTSELKHIEISRVTLWTETVRYSLILMHMVQNDNMVFYSFVLLFWNSGFLKTCQNFYAVCSLVINLLSRLWM